MTSLEQFEQTGFVRQPGLLDRDELESLRSAIDESPGDDPSINPLSLGTMEFSSNLFRSSSFIRHLLSSPKVVDLLTSVGAPSVWIRWDQAVSKGPGAPLFPWHQDNGYTGLAATHLQLWIAVTPTDAHNGALMVVPGGHHDPLPHRWVGNHVQTDPPGEIETVSTSPGDAVIFSSFLPHATTANTSGEERLAYVAEFLPLDESDPTVPTPHFIISRAGCPAPGWSDLTGSWKPAG